jgi:hypothetical protein
MLTMLFSLSIKNRAWGFNTSTLVETPEAPAGADEGGGIGLTRLAGRRLCID